MPSHRVIIFALLAASLAGCMNIHNPDRLKETQTGDLCEMYFFTSQPSIVHDTSWPTKKADIKKELDHRQAVAPDDWAFIDQGKLQVGANECALEAAWGHPLRVTHASTAAGNTAHYTYSLTRTADMADGKLTSFQY